MARKKLNLLNTKDVEIYLMIEDFDGLFVPFIHVYFHKWSPSVYKATKKWWREFRLTFPGPIYGIANHDDDNVHEKFVKNNGFEFFQSLTCPDGKIRPCYVSWGSTNG